MSQPRGVIILLIPIFGHGRYHVVYRNSDGLISLLRHAGLVQVSEKGQLGRYHVACHRHGGLCMYFTRTGIVLAASDMGGTM